MKAAYIPLLRLALLPVPLLAMLVAMVCTGCAHKPGKLFEQLTPAETGINFVNTIQESVDANLLNYAYFYNGGGVAAGDIDNDGLPDILFTGNMSPNRLYRNKGNFTFEDITESSGIAAAQGWCTGATMADVNGDGLLDIYICRSADSDPARRRNLLYINLGHGKFREAAAEYGLADEGYSTQAVFFDYDGDGDLDLFLANHSLQQYATGSETAEMRRQRLAPFADKLYRNDHGHFTDVSQAAGITSNELTFGLGVVVSDLNNDGWPDIYVSNDFNEADYLFMNNGNGTFTESLGKSMDQVSLYSMGCDAADFDNDGRPDLITLDMSPAGNFSQKMHTGAENFDKFQALFKQGFNPQYSRNMLHRNNGDGSFSEMAQLAGVANTDWSWSALFADFDNDGNKDLFITSGYAKDNTDMDFMKYRIARQMQARGAAYGALGAYRALRASGASGSPGAELVQELIGKMPAMPLPNHLFRNDGRVGFDDGGGFADVTQSWGMGAPGFSSGAAYADLDGDGALDLVVNNINEPAGIFRNNARALYATNNFLAIALKGAGANTMGVGAKVRVYCQGHQFMQEAFTVRGFQSAMDPVLVFGLGHYGLADSILVNWADGGVARRMEVKANQRVAISEGVKDAEVPDGKSAAIFAPMAPALFAPMAGGLFVHQQQDHHDLSVQPLLSEYLSVTGPCMAKADINGDGREDIFIGGGRGQPGLIALQGADGGFVTLAEPAIGLDSAKEAVAAVFFDADGDGDADLYIAYGGYAAKAGGPDLQDCLYLNDGHGHFTKAAGALPDRRYNKQCVRVVDIDHDGDLDIFIGGGVVPGKYPEADPSAILLNDGKGHFTELNDPGVTALKGLVNDAAWADLNKDGYPDLVIAGRWMPLTVLINEHGKFVDRSPSYMPFASHGWWNSIAAADLDGDGNIDLLVGNQGLNNAFGASPQEPLTLYDRDFDGNGVDDPVLSYYLQDTAYPVYDRDDLMEQLPGLKKEFPEYHDYARASMATVFGEGLALARTYRADQLATLYLHNTGKGSFTVRPLPREVQLSPVYAICAGDLNHDGSTDLVLCGNNAWNRIRFGRYRANHGLVLINDGKGNFSLLPQSATGLKLRGDVRSMELIHGQKGIQLVVGMNGDSVRRYALGSP